MKNKITVGIFALLLIGMSLINITKRDIMFSKTENRYLASFPKYNNQDLLSGKYTQEVENYTSDHFVFRDQWVGIKTLSELAIGKRDNQRVYFGKDSWLFSIDESFNLEQYKRNIEALSTFNDNNQDTYITYALVPNKINIMSQYAPTNAPYLDDEELIKQIKMDLGNKVKYHDFLEVLNAHKDESIYFKTDHHWTSLGAYYAYQSLLGDDALKLESFKKDRVSEEFCGTDYRKANAQFIKPDVLDVLLNPDVQNSEIMLLGSNEKKPLYDASFLAEMDQYSYYQGGNQSPFVIDGLKQDGTSLLLIKDSFANSLLPFLLPHYKSITVVDLRHYNGSVNDLVEASNVNEIMVLMNARTLVQDSVITKMKR